MHIPVYNADNEAKRLTASDAGIRGELIALLGEDVYKDGLLNKPLLASYLFSDPAHVLQINSIIHPRVRKDFTVWVERQEKCEEKRRRADFTVVNDGVQLLIPQLNRIVEQLKTEKFIL